MPDYKVQSKTKISRKASTYMESAEKYLGTSRTLKAKFGKLKKTINAILQKTTELETVNEEGMLPLMSGQDITTLISLYDEALKDVLAVAKLGEEKGHGKDSAFFKSVEKVADFLNSDKKKLATYDEKQPMALSDFIVSTKANYVDLTNVDKQSMSGACNSRIPIEVTLPGAEEGVKGVFTEERILTSKDRYDLVRQALNYDVLNQFF